MKPLCEEVSKLARRLELLNQISGDALANVARDVELRLSNLGATAGAIDPVQLKINTQTGVDNTSFAENQAIRRAAEATVSTIDRESLVILKCLHGDDPITLARHWREIQKLHPRGR